MTVNVIPEAGEPGATPVRQAVFCTCDPAGMPRPRKPSRSGPGDMPSPDGRRRGGEAGFTLLELLVVIVILGLLIGLVAPAALRQLGGAKISIAHQSIERVS